MGGRGSNSGFVTVGNIKMRTGRVDKMMIGNTIETETGLVFTYNGDEYGVIGNDDHGYAVTLISTGLLVGDYKDTAEDAVKNIAEISKTLHRLKPGYLQSLIDAFEAAKKANKE